MQKPKKTTVSVEQAETQTQSQTVAKKTAKTAVKTKASPVKTARKPSTKSKVASQSVTNTAHQDEPHITSKTPATVPVKVVTAPSKIIEREEIVPRAIARAIARPSSK